MADCLGANAHSAEKGVHLTVMSYRVKDLQTALVLEELEPVTTLSGLDHTTSRQSQENVLAFHSVPSETGLDGIRRVGLRDTGPDEVESREEVGQSVPTLASYVRDSSFAYLTRFLARCCGFRFGLLLHERSIPLPFPFFNHNNRSLFDFQFVVFFSRTQPSVGALRNPLHGMVSSLNWGRIIPFIVKGLNDRLY